ncbi:hypothetical protein BD626DRAFT_568398 [Schizophyllum amplum]|uniref:Uncharacterized protein n=1 Tax=Schizophyllum amplum TaxID=97359 RepID=A0A550CG36_9AGAR|nr:hypothetical protein BD626DRAFT_568398 [Auriculariopsis ampla]
MPNQTRDGLPIATTEDSGASYDGIRSSGSAFHDAPVLVLSILTQCLRTGHTSA